jgi:hypothetical protein
VRLPATVAAQHKLANAVVTNISEAGCELRLVTPFDFSHYLTLKIYPQAGTPKWQIPHAEIIWIQHEWADLKFIGLSQADKATLQRLCGGFVAFP